MKERTELINSIIDAMAEKFASEELVRQAVYDWEPPISQMALRFEEGLRKHIPQIRKAIAPVAEPLEPLPAETVIIPPAEISKR
jgi:hypothetical protein